MISLSLYIYIYTHMYLFIYMTIPLSFRFAVFSTVQCRGSGFRCKFRGFKTNFTFTLNSWQCTLNSWTDSKLKGKWNGCMSIYSAHVALLSESSFCDVVPVSLEKTLLRRRGGAGRTAVKAPNQGLESSFLPLDSMARARIKGVFFTDTGMTCGCDVRQHKHEEKQA